MNGLFDKKLMRILVAALLTVSSFSFYVCDDDQKDNNASMIIVALLGGGGDRINIFSGGPLLGGLGGRDGADALCRTAQSGFPALAGKKVKAFISVSATDQIKDVVPAAYQDLPVYGIKPGDAKMRIKDSWTNLWSSGIGASLEAATGIDKNWWSGSNIDGSVHSWNCTAWTVSTTGVGIGYQGETGSYMYKDTTWLNHSGSSCNASQYLLCVAYEPKLVLYDGGTHDGALGGRSGADGICDAAAAKPAGIKNVHAFISISAPDQIADMHTNYGYPTGSKVYGPDGATLIANSFDDLRNGNDLLISLQGAGVFSAAASYWWSGSNDNGTYYSGYTECDNFTTNGGTSVWVGSSDDTTLWIGSGGDFCSAANRHVLCMGEQ